VPQYHISPVSHAYYEHDINDPPQSQDFTITNVGGSVLNIVAVWLGEQEFATTDGYFTLSELDTLPIELEYNQSTSFTVTYAPADLNFHETHIYITTPDPYGEGENVVHSVHLSGSGTEQYFPVQNMRTEVSEGAVIISWEAPLVRSEERPSVNTDNEIATTSGKQQSKGSLAMTRDGVLAPTMTNSQNEVATTSKQEAKQNHPLPPQPPPAPSKGGEGKIKSRNDEVHGDDGGTRALVGYKIYRDDDPLNEGEIIYETSFTDTDIIWGDTYYYEITAVYSFGGESDAQEIIIHTPQFSIDHNSFNFGTLTVFDTDEQVFTITNHGGDVLKIFSVEVDEESAFTVSELNPVSLAANQTTSFTVTFAPSDLIYYEAELTIVTNTGEHKVNLTGNANQQKGNLLGVVKNTSGNALNSVGIGLFTNPTDEEPEYSTTTDENGEYSITDIFIGEYVLLAVKEGYFAYEYTIVITANADSTHNFVMHSITPDTDEVELPLATILSGNYPNPFNPSTTIRFDLAKKTQVSIEIFNLKGAKVRNLLNAELTAGTHRVLWNGRDDKGQMVGSGIYFYRMRAGDFTETKKMMLLK
jgi:hypothetical protein